MNPGPRRHCQTVALCLRSIERLAELRPKKTFEEDDGVAGIWTLVCETLSGGILLQCRRALGGGAATGRAALRNGPSDARRGPREALYSFFGLLVCSLPCVFTFYLYVCELS